MDDFTDLAVKRFNNAIIECSSDFINLFTILRRIKIRPSYSISTACISDNFHCLFNPKFVSTLNDVELRFVVMHETFHILLKHVTRFKNMNDDRENALEAWNIASDYFINDNLFKAMNIHIDGLVDFQSISKISGIKEKHKIDSMSVESLYSLILEKIDEEDNSNSNESNSESKSFDSKSNENDLESAGNCSNTNKNNFESKESNYKSDNNSEQENNNSKCKNNNNQQNSSLKNELEKFNNKSVFDRFKDLNEVEKAFKDIKYDDSQFDFDNGDDKYDCAFNDRNYIKSTVEKNFEWRKILKDFAWNTSVRHHTSKSWRRPSKRYRDIYPISKGRIRKENKDFVFSIDISGSMNEQLIQQIFNIIAGYARKEGSSFNYFFFSSKRSKLYTFNSISKFQKDFQEASETVERNSTMFSAATDIKDLDLSGLVLLSDMQFSDCWGNCGIEEANKILDSYSIPYLLINVSDVHCFMSESDKCLEPFC